MARMHLSHVRKLAMIASLTAIGFYSNQRTYDLLAEPCSQHCDSGETVSCDDIHCSEIGGSPMGCGYFDDEDLGMYGCYANCGKKGNQYTACKG